MSLLGVLHLGGVDPRLVRHVLLAVELDRLVAGSADRLIGQGDRVGTHVGDEATLVELLGDAHRPVRGETEFAASFLLHRRGAERGVGTAGVRLGLDVGDGIPGLLQPGGDGSGTGLVKMAQVSCGEFTVGGEVTSSGNPNAVQTYQSGREVLAVLGCQGGSHVPVVGAGEGDTFPLSVHHEPGGDRLDASGRQLRLDLLPQHRGDLVAVEPVENTSGLLGVDKVVVEFPSVLDGLEDGFLGDLVEDHPLHRHLGFELVEQVPGDCLSLTVTIGGEVELVGLLEQPLELSNRRLLLRGHDVDRCELVIDVHTGARPRLPLVLRRDLGRARREVTDVPLAGPHDVLGSQISANHRRLVGRLDDDKALGGCHT